MPTFDVAVVGCGGGPSEHNLSSYLLKLSHRSWCDGIVALDAGSGLGALSHILQTSPDLFGARATSLGGDGNPYTAVEVLSGIRCYLITHAHMDHINSLVLSTGSLEGPSRRVYAMRDVLKDIESVFSDRLWPNLASWNEDPESLLTYSCLQVDGQYTEVATEIAVRTMPLSHGTCRSGNTYKSSAFFIRHTTSGQEFLFLGDVEPDAVSAEPRNHDLWCAAAPKIPQSLSTIFIECSYPLGRRSDHLYGHLSPEYLVKELITLANEVVKSRRNGLQAQPARKKPRTEGNSTSFSDRQGVLKGTRVYITHCKDNFSRGSIQPIQQVIVGQIRELLQKEKLGVDVIAVEQGMMISI